MSKDKIKSKTVKCPHCSKDVKPIVKVFHTNICPSCNKIISSDCSIDKVNRWV